MSTFAELCALPSPGLAFLVDVSTDYFATFLTVSGVTQRWSTSAGFYSMPSNNFYEAGIASISRHQRSLGTDGLPNASTISLVLDNTDGAFDWLVYRTTVESTVFKARFRVTAVVYDPANPSDHQVQQLGIFQPLDMPSRDESTVRLELADDVLGDAADLTLTPSALDWLNHASTTSGNTPWAASSGVLSPNAKWAPGFDPDRPLPLAFGRVPVPIQPLVVFDGGAVPLAICCTTNTSALSGSEQIERVWSQSLGDGPGNGQVDLPRNLYSLDRTPFTIAKDGRTWYVWLVQLDLNAMRDSSWVMQTVLAGELGQGSSVNRRTMFEAFLSKVGQLYCYFWPASSRTNPVVPPASQSSVQWPRVTCVDIARDILTYYARTGVSLDTSSFDDVNAELPGSAGLCHIGSIGQEVSVQQQRSIVGEVGQLRGVIQGLCQSGGFDLVTLANGAIRALASTASYAAYVAGSLQTVQRLDEERIVDGSLEFRTPSQGQRWAPYNRVFIDLGVSAGESRAGRNGPYDHAGNIVAWGRPFTRIISAQYADVRFGEGFSSLNSAPGTRIGYGGGLESGFALESKVRPVVSFRYGLEALQLELGSYFLMSATRGNQTTLLDTYVDTLWKVEALNLTPETGQVEVEAVWVNDLIEEIPFLLDDETLGILREQSSTYNGGGVTLSVTNTNVVTFSAGDIVASATEVGDILVLQDGSEGAGDFERNRGIRISAIDSATQVRTSDTILSAVGPVSVSTWKILRGYTTYPILGDANYADGSLMYGKAAATKNGGVFSNSDDANRLSGG